MENALLFTGLLLGAALAGGYFGSCCKSRQGEELAQKLQALQDRLEFLETKTQDVDERLAECELLIGDPPTEGLLGRVGELEEARRREDLLQRVNVLTDEVRGLEDKSGPKLADLAACVDAQGEKLELLQGKHELFVGGASLELEGLRMAVEKLEGKANG